MPAYFKLPLSQLTSTPTEGASKWRIFHEESVDLNPREERTDFEELRGRGDTRIYRHGQTELAVSTEVTRTYDRLAAMPGMRKKNGCVLLFNDEQLDVVAEAIYAKHRRQMTPEQREALIESGRGTRLSATLKPPKTDAS